MGEYDERSLDDLTEEASPHRLEELRQKGQVAQSRELSGTIGLLGIMMALYFLSGRYVAEMSSFMKEVFTKELLANLTTDGSEAYLELLSRSGRMMVLAFLPIGGASLVLGILSSVAQVGFFVTTDTLAPDFERVNPISGFFRVFSLKSLVEGARSVLKVIVIAGVVYFTVRSEIFEIPNTVSFGVQQLMSYIGKTTTRIFGVVGMLLLAVSGLDYWIQWRRFQMQAMMTKAEAKQELKEREGDPQIKARIRSVQRDMARKRMMKAIPQADVIVTNPTHIAVAIKYDPNESFAPKVIAKGGDFLAERIKKIARENGIPTVENKPLARTLYKYVKVGQMIPRSLYQAVAEILAYVYKIKGKKGIGSRPEQPQI